MTMLEPIFLMTIAALLIATVYSDLRYQRIKNIWIVSSTLCSFAAHFLLGSWGGLSASLLGLTVGLGLFLPIYIMGGMAAGDVKLMASVGAILGYKLAWIAVLSTLISGGILAIIYIALRGDLNRYLSRYGLILSNFLATRKAGLSYLAPGNDEVAAQRFPYALAIAGGALISLIFFLHRLPDYMLVTY